MKGWTESRRKSYSLRCGCSGLDQGNRKMERSSCRYYGNQLDRCCNERVEKVIT